MTDPSQARYRSAVALQRLANALGVELNPTAEDCECLERLANAAERANARPSFWNSREEIPDERSPEDIYTGTE